MTLSLGDSLRNPPVEIRRKAQILRFVQSRPHSLLQRCGCAALGAGNHVMLKPGGNISIQSPGAVTNNQLRTPVQFK